MIEQNYEEKLSRTFDFLLVMAENNGFYSPTRQKVCYQIYEKKDRTVAKLESAVKFLERRFKEQDLDAFLENPICQNVFNTEQWKTRWPQNIMVLHDGEEKIHE